MRMIDGLKRMGTNLQNSGCPQRIQEWMIPENISLNEIDESMTITRWKKCAIVNYREYISGKNIPFSSFFYREVW